MRFVTIRVSRWCYALAAAAGIAATSVVIAQDAVEKPKPSGASKDATLDDQVKQRLKNAYERQAKHYQITVEGDSQPLELLTNPVFNWVNRARIGQQTVHFGSVYVWTHHGRAEVVGTIFSVSKEGASPSYYHELHSLATVPLKANAEGELRWDLPEAGARFAPFTNADVPAETPTRRLIQMKSQARRFSGHSINYDQTRWELNLLPQPIYRLPKPTETSLDQAVFALVSTAGTDPEVLLVIEARKSGSAFRWEYAVCRFTDLTTYVTLDDKDVWSFPNGTKGPYVDSGVGNRYRFLAYSGQSAE